MTMSRLSGACESAAATVSDATGGLPSLSLSSLSALNLLTPTLPPVTAAASNLLWSDSVAPVLPTFDFLGPCISLVLLSVVGLCRVQPCVHTSTHPHTTIASAVLA